MSATVCTDTGKRGYVDEHDAVHALRRAQGVARKLRRDGVKGVRRQECRVYLCGCGRYHLTSWSEGMLTNRTMSEYSVDSTMDPTEGANDEHG
jgi:hypothetical protein